MGAGSVGRKVHILQAPKGPARRLHSPVTTRQGELSLSAPVVQRWRPRELTVLVGCESSGRVREAFARRGHDAWSCDLLPAEDGSNRHIVGDVREQLRRRWNLVFIAHPPCTRLCNSGVRWLRSPPPGRSLDEMWDELRAAAAFFSDCWEADAEMVAIENPIMHGHAKALIRRYQPPVQLAQPWWFGDPFFKRCGLHLRRLPPLAATNKLTPPAYGTEEHKAWSRIHRMPGNGDRSRERSRTFPGMAEAMAEQWGGDVYGRAAA